MKKFSHNQAIAVMLLVTFMWSTAGVITRHLEYARSFEVTFWRALFTALALLVLLPLMQGREVFQKIRTSPWPFWVSAFCWSVMFTAFMVALTLTSVANVLITMSLGPLFTALIARIFIGHRIPPRTLIAIFVAGFGIFYIYASQIGQGSMIGSLVALCVPVAAATNWTITQSAQRHGQNIDLVPAVLVGAVISSALTLPLAWPLQASVHDVSLLAILGVFQLAVPCVLSVICARVLKAPEVSLLALLEVLFGIVLTWIGANEAPTPTVLIGGFLVIGSLVTNEILGFRERS